MPRSLNNSEEKTTTLREPRSRHSSSKSIVVRTSISTNTIRRRRGDEEAARCIANVSSRSTPDSEDPWSGGSNRSSVTTAESGDEQALSMLKTKQNRPRRRMTDEAASEKSEPMGRPRSRTDVSPMEPVDPRMAALESKLQASKARTRKSQQLFKRIPVPMTEGPPSPSFFYPEADAKGKDVAAPTDERLSKHFRDLERVLEKVPVTQTSVPEGSQRRNDSRQHDRGIAAASTSVRQAEHVIPSPQLSSNSSIAGDTQKVLHALKHKHAHALVETVRRHRNDQAELLSSPQAVVLLNKARANAAFYENESEAVEATKSSILASLLPAQDQERQTLKAQQARELAKWQARGEQAARLAESGRRDPIFSAQVEETARMEIERKGQQQEKDKTVLAWWDIVFGERESQLFEGLEKFDDATRSHAPSPRPVSPMTTTTTVKAKPSRQQSPQRQRQRRPSPPTTKAAAVAGISSPRPGSSQGRKPLDSPLMKRDKTLPIPPPPKTSSPPSASLMQASSSTNPKSKRTSPPPPSISPSTSSTSSSSTASSVSTSRPYPRQQRVLGGGPGAQDRYPDVPVAEPHPGRRIHYGPTQSWIESEYSRALALRMQEKV